MKILALVCLFFAAHAAHADARLSLVASFSILGDLVKRVSGEHARVVTLVGANADMHAFKPTPADARAIANADAFFINGLGLEGRLERLHDDANIVVASAGITPVHASEHHGHGHSHAHDHGHGHGHEDEDDHEGDIDPHAWHSVPNAMIYVNNIAAALCRIDAGACDAYRANAKKFLRELRELDAEIRASLASVDAAERIVVVPHDAFGYFAAEYGVRFIALRGVSTDADVSAGKIARLIDAIRKTDARALFVENISNPRLIKRIARETGLSVGQQLYSDALSAPNGAASSYARMMQYNAHAIVRGIKQSRPAL